MSIQLQNKKGVESLKFMTKILLTEQAAFLTRLQKELISTTLPFRVYELQRDISSILFHMAIAASLSTGIIPSFVSTRLPRAFHLPIHGLRLLMDMYSCARIHNAFRFEGPGN